jgi:hypothetical protein
MTGLPPKSWLICILESSMCLRVCAMPFTHVRRLFITAFTRLVRNSNINTRSSSRFVQWRDGGMFLWERWARGDLILPYCDHSRKRSDAKSSIPRFHTQYPRELVSFGVKNRKGEPHIDRRYARCCDTSRRRDVGRGGGWRESGNVKARACIPMVQAIRLLMLWCASQKQGMVSMCCGDLLYFIAIYIHIVLNFLHQRLVNPIIDEFSITKQLFCSLEMLRNALMHSLLHFPKPISTQSPQHSFTLVSIGKIKTLLFPLSHFSIRLLASFLGVSQGLAQGTSLLKKNKTVVKVWDVYNGILQTTMCVSFNL